MTAVSYSLSRRPLLAAAIAVLMAAACGHDSSNVTTSPGTSSGITVTIDNGSNLQIAIVNSTIHVSVHAANSNGSPVVGQIATWAVTAGNGLVSVPTSTTNSSGQASTDWKLGTAAGINNLTVSISGAVVTISATGAPGVMTGLIKISPDPQSIVSTSATSVIVRAADVFGNGIAGVVVTWTASGGTLNLTTTKTGDSGNAQVTFTTGPLPATYSITATAAGFAAKTFMVTGL